jgi:hypothetical protein
MPRVVLPAGGDGSEAPEMFTDAGSHMESPYITLMT